MAWIKLHGELWESWKIMRLCSALKINEAQAVGHLVSLWCFTERMAWRDGDLSKWGEVGLAKAARWTGNAEAMVKALREACLLDQDTLIVHEWTEHQAGMIHNREARSPGKIRGKIRENIGEIGENTAPDKSRVDKRRVEKRREEKKESLSIKSFASFWSEYPNKVGKGAALKAWEKAQPDLDACLKALAWQKLQPQWTKDGGRFIPHPSTWINQRRWEDEPVQVDGGNAARPVPGKYESDCIVEDGVVIKGGK